VAGILDSKSRIIDFSLTPQGRAQLASGRIRFSKASVSDRSSFYEQTGEGASDATERIYFETYSTSADQVTLETSDNGQLVPFVTPSYTVTSTGIYTSAGDPVLDGNIFSSVGSDIAGASGDNFASLKVLITDDPDDRRKTDFKVDGKSFLFYPTMPDFRISPDRHIDEIESLLFDKRLNRQSNFKFLPPVNENGSRLGYYSDVRQRFEENEDASISNLLSGASGTRYQVFTSIFRQTSPQNSINLQIFETTKKAGIRKLDLIDFGRVKFRGRDAHVAFAGRVIRNSFEFPVFVNMLTLVLV
jgi:hypothetical protein